MYPGRENVQPLINDLNRHLVDGCRCDHISEVANSGHARLIQTHI